MNDKSNDVKNKKVGKLFNKINRILGDKDTEKLNNAIKTGVEAIKVANRMNKNN